MNIFLSYKWEDRAYLNGFAGLMQNPNNMYRHIPIHERKNFQGEEEVVWKCYIRELMKNCDVGICLLGQ